MILSRRQMLGRFANGFGLLGLAGLFGKDLFAGPALFPARAKRIIFLFMSGGPSHVDTFDPKPRLAKENGKPLPFEKPKLERTRTGNILQSPFTFRKYGQAGIDISELFQIGRASCRERV